LLTLIATHTYSLNCKRYLYRDLFLCLRHNLLAIRFMIQTTDNALGNLIRFGRN
jgi:hypothetical protein